MEFCKECGCSCKPIDKECIPRYSAIKDPLIIQPDHYQKATNDIDQLIGPDCADELCQALKDAAQEAEDNSSIDILAYLDQAWKDIIENDHFKMWYANKLLWHLLNGPAISEITARGLVTTSKSDSDYKSDYEHASKEELQAMKNSAKFYYDQAKSRFEKRFWCHNKHKYNCAELDCGCTKHYKCHTHKKKKGGGIGMRVI